MAAILYRARAEMRTTWRSALSLAVLVALLAGTVLASVAGARRTVSAFPRMQAETEAPEVLTGLLEGGIEESDTFRDALFARPEVAEASEIIGVPILPLRGSPTADLVDEHGSFESRDLGLPLAASRGGWGDEFARPVVRSGRLPDRDAIDEVLVSTLMADRTGLQVGDVLEVVLADDAKLDDFRDATTDQGIPLHLRVTGTGTFSAEVIPVSDLDAQGVLLLPAAVADLVRRNHFEPFFSADVVDLEPGTDLAAFGRTMRELAAGLGAGSDGLLFTDLQANSEQVQSAIEPLGVALNAFAAVVALMGLFVVGQAIARHTRIAPADAAALTAVGVGRGARVAVPVLRALAISVLGATGAVAAAIAASAWFPIGPARAAEPSSGVDVDAPVLLVGFAAVTLLVALSAAPGALLRTRVGHAASRPPRTPSAAMGRAGFGVAAVQGVRFALDRANRDAPVRSTLTAAATATAFVLAAATFAAGLAALVDQPSRYGQGWDRLADGEFSPVAAPRLMTALDELPEVVGVGAGTYIEVELAGERVPGVAMQDLRGEAGLTVVDGRRAERAGEIALGDEVMRRAGVRVGDLVDVDTGSGPTPLRVVGRVLFPRMNRGSFNGTGLGLGAQIHPAEARPYDPTQDGEPPPGLTFADYELGGRYFNFLTIDIEGPPSRVDAVLDGAVERFEVLSVTSQDPPTAISDLNRVRTVPVTLAGVLSLAAAAMLAHLLVSSVSARRRDLALLRTLGLRSRQVRAAVSWQAIVVALIATAIGVPLGLAVGRTAWRVFATDIGAPSPSTVPWLWVVLAPVVAVALAAGVAAVPGWRASRIRPAAVLRGER